MSRITCWTAGVPNPTPILTCLGGTVITRALNIFEPHELTFAASDARTIQALAPWTLLEIVQEGVGTIGFGYSTNPRQDIDQQGNHVITMALEPLTLELTWRRTGRGWQAKNYLSVVGTRLMALMKEQQWSSFMVAAPADDIIVQVKLNNPTLLAAYLDTAAQFDQYVRMGASSDGSLVDANGNPLRFLEMGQFGAGPTVWIVSPNGATADDASNNTLIRLPATVSHEPNNVEDLCTITVPFGGGQDTDSTVDVERLWRMRNDPTYPGYGRWGTDAESIARTGLPSLFTEYDAAYPISDPENPPTGQFQFLFTDTNGNPVSGNYAAGYGGKNPIDGSVPLVVTLNGAVVTNVFATLMQGPLGTRRVTLDGHFDYVMYDRDAYALYGHKETKDFIDSSLNYTSSAPADQEYTARALYQETAAFFKRYSHPHTTFTATVNDARTLPPLAGDLIAVDYQKVSVADDGAVVEMDVTENLRLMKAARTFNGDDPAVDTLTLSNLGRFDATDASGQADTTRAIVAMQRNMGTGLAKDSIVIRDNIDAANPITHWLYNVPEHFAWHQVRVRCDFLPFRGTATTATNIAGTPIVAVGSVAISLPTPADLNALTAPIGGMPLHFHQLPLLGAAGGLTPTASTDDVTHTSKWAYTIASGGQLRIVINNSGAGVMETNNQILRPDLTATTHPHVVAKSGDTVAHIPAGTQLATLPAHVHDVEKRIPTGTPSPASILFSVNGVSLSSGAAATGTRNLAGAFTGSFVVNDIGPTLDLYPPGTDIPIRFEAGIDPVSNPFGVGYLVITITSVEELGGLSSTIRAA